MRRGRLFNQLTALVNQPIRLAARQRFAAHLAIELPAVFSFLFDPTVDATNWRAAQALRPAARDVLVDLLRARQPTPLARAHYTAVN